MIQTYYQTGLSANYTNINPSPGYKWNLLYAYVVIHASATAGSRSVIMQRYSSQFSLNSPEEFASASGSSTSADITGDGGFSPTSLAGSTITWYGPIMLSYDQTARIYVSLQSGDTYDFYLLFDEVIDD